MLVLVLLIAAGLWTVTRSWFIIGQLTPELERKLGGKVTIGQAAYQGDGRIIFTDVTLRARGLRGKGGEVARIGRAVVTLDSLLSGFRVVEVEIEDSTLRLSEDKHQSGHINFMSLLPDWSGTGSGPAIPPRISIRNAALEFGTHSGAEYEAHGRRLVSGEMYPTSGAPGSYNFQLAEVDEQGTALGQSGIFIKGQWKPSTNEYHARIDGLELDDRVYKLCPQKAQLLWQSMNLQGTVDAVMADWTPGLPFSVEFAVKNVALTLPINVGELWARYKEGQISPISARPRLHVSSGTIRLGGDSLVLDKLKGELGSADTTADLVGVPYNISFTLAALPPIDWSNREEWMDQVLKTAPFDLKFRMDEFSLARNEAGEVPAVDLPLVVAKVLAKFQVTDWVLSTSVEMSRATGTDEHGNAVEGAPITTGQAYIHKASGRYQKFPYQLDDIDAYLQFDNDKVVVHYLTGKGSGDSQIRISGEIAPPDNDARVSLHLSGTHVPLDDRLRAALTDRELQAFDAMFHRPFAESLAKAGLLLDQSWLDAAKKGQQAAGERLAQLQSEAGAGAVDQAPEIATLEAEMSRTQRSIDAGPFQLGGTIDLELNIDRPAGPAQPTVTTGTIGIQNAGLLYERFPYPLRFTSGTLNWEPDRISIAPGTDGEGLHFIAPGGGVGSATGELVIGAERSHRKMLPNLTIKVRDDALTPSIYAAIPLTKSEQSQLTGDAAWPGGVMSHAASIVQGIGLSGGCDFSGVIAADATDAMTYNFAVTLNDGGAKPAVQFAQALGASAEFWPPGFALRDITGALSISRDQIQWTKVAGKSGESDVVSDGSIDLTGDNPGTHVTVDLKKLPLDACVLNLVSAETHRRLQDAWDRYQPQGLFDAAVAYDSRLEPGGRMTVGIQPKQIGVLLDSQQLMLTATDGRMSLTAGAVGFDQLILSMSGEGDRDDGMLTLNGLLPVDGVVGDSKAALDGAWSHGRLESPLVPELMYALGAQHIESYRACHAVGQFDATFHLEPASDSSGMLFDATIEPHSIGVEWNGARVFTEIERGQVLLKPGAIHLQELRGRHSDGVFDLSGVIKTAQSVEAEVSIGYSGKIRSPQVEAFLPEKAREALDAIKFDDGDSPTRADFNIHCTQIQYEGDDPAWQSEVNGRVQTLNAAFEAGIKFSQVRGEFDLDVQHVPGSPAWLTLQARAQRAVVLGQELTNIEAPMALSTDGRVLRMPSMRAEAGSGIVTAEASVGIDDRRDYQTSLQLVGVPADSFMNAGREQPRSTAADEDKARSPGEVYGSLTLSGNRGETHTRSGRALLRMLHGKVASIPLAMQVVQMFQFTLPFSGTFDYADANMYVTGNRVVFERILFESTLGNKAMLQLLGEGEMDIDSLELNARFRSRSGVAVVRDTVGSILDRLYEIEVSGPLGDPHARVVALPAK